MRLAIRQVLIAVFLLAAGPGAMQEAQSRAEDAASTAPESLTGVMFAPTRPLMIRLTVQVDGSGLSSFREQFTTKWFQDLDKNRDGVLDETEAAEIAAATVAPGEVATDANWRGFDTSPSDGKLQPPEFHAYASAALGRVIETVGAEKNTDNAASLFGQLDVDHDGALTKEELAKASEVLGPLDADEDETISEAELNAAAKAAGSGLPGSPRYSAALIALIDDKNTAQAVAERVMRQYDSASGTGDRLQPPDGVLDAAELGLTADEVKPYDGDGNEKLDVAELAQLIVAIPPRVGVTVNLFDTKRGQAALLLSPTSADQKFEIKSASPDSSTMSMNAFQVGYRAERTRSSVGDSTRYYTLRMRLVDKDKNGYLDDKEFPGLSLPEATLEAVDADGNKQIVEKELVDFLQKAKAVRMNQIVMRITDESKPLFKFLDSREDGRLSPRELMSAAERIKSVDGNNDGKVTRAELTTQIAIDFTVKRPIEQRPGMVAMAAPQARSTVASRDSGPDWFLRMDRNYDGDVSWREFLGPRKVFDRLDVDHDGLLSPQEAEKAK